MPLGNLTSQIFANVYLNELDQFVKHRLKARCYLRYVDDFVVLSNDKKELVEYRKKIDHFLKEKLATNLHPQKSKIYKLGDSVNVLGFRTFYYYRLLRKSNIRKRKVRLRQLKEGYDAGKIEYDEIYDFFEGWLNYASHANTHKLRKIVTSGFDTAFHNEYSTKEINRLQKLIPSPPRRTT